MATSSWLATWLDVDHLVQQGVTLHGPLDYATAGLSSIPVRAGAEVATELGGRKLLRYLTPAQLGCSAMELTPKRKSLLRYIRPRRSARG